MKFPAIKRLFLTTAGVIAAGVLPFVALELGLQAFGYGYATSFFIPINGKSAFTSNEKFGWRFFPPSMARVPVVSFIPAQKTVDTYRIFVLGDSAAMGIPEPAFSFGRMLQAMLTHQYPGVKFEVVNTAMTAINSHVLLPIAADSARLSPDLFVVLAGNNEVVGPYGPGTVLAGYSPALALVRAGIWFKATRTAQLMEHALPGSAVPGPVDKAKPEWGGMAMFTGHQVSQNDPRLTTVYRNFRANLESICQIAQQAGASAILATVPVNLHGSAPFVSLHRHGLSAIDLARWQQLYDQGTRHASAGDCPGARTAFLQAMQIDDRYADLHYRLGQCPPDLRELKQARDLDALRFRADSQINQTIRDTATHAPVRLVDAEQAFAQSARQDLFYEHVHLTFPGNYLLATTILTQVETALPSRLRTHRSAVPALSESEVAEALGFTEWDRDKSAMEMLTMMQQPPFTAQPDYMEKKPSRDRTLAELREKWASPRKLAGISEHFAQYAATLSRHPEDLDLREIYAELLSKSGNYPAAAEQYRALIALVPGIARWHANLAHALLEQGQFETARAEAESARQLDPQLAAAPFTLAQILERTGQPVAAVADYETTLRLKPDDADAILRLAILFSRQSRYREAADHYTRYLRLSPGTAEAHSNLGFLLVKLGDVRGAVPEYREALRLRPAFPEAANNLGAALERLGETTESIAYYRAALKLRPDFPEARRRLADAVARQSPHPATKLPN